jgi:hypothetical protein
MTKLRFCSAANCAAVMRRKPMLASATPPVALLYLVTPFVPQRLRECR